MKRFCWTRWWKTTTPRTGTIMQRASLSLVLTFYIKQGSLCYFSPRPVFNESEPIDVTFGLNLQQIVDLVGPLMFILCFTCFRMKRTNCWQPACGLIWWVGPFPFHVPSLVKKFNSNFVGRGVMIKAEISHLLVNTHQRHQLAMYILQEHISFLGNRPCTYRDVKRT